MNINLLDLYESLGRETFLANAVSLGVDVGTDEHLDVAVDRTLDALRHASEYASDQKSLKDYLGVLCETVILPAISNLNLKHETKISAKIQIFRLPEDEAFTVGLIVKGEGWHHKNKNGVKNGTPRAVGTSQTTYCRMAKQMLSHRHVNLGLDENDISNKAAFTSAILENYVEASNAAKALNLETHSQKFLVAVHTHEYPDLYK